MIYQCFTQPTGARVRLSYGHMPSGGAMWAMREINGDMNHALNGWPPEVVWRALADWTRFERRIGSRHEPTLPAVKA